MPDPRNNPALVSFNRFILGILLTWAPFAMMAFLGFARALGEIENQKATGLGAVAGGLSNNFATFGIIEFLATQVMAIVLLARCIGKGETSQTVVVVLSMGMSLLGIVATVLSIWAVVFMIPHWQSR
jgi:hypothetical protein